MAVSRKTVTVLFADVADSTGLGERLDPESLRGVISRYFETARIVLERHGGTVEKFIGDAVMAVFGVPQLHEDDAVRAVRAAAELRAAIRRLNEELERERDLHLGIRIGINTGEVVAGDGRGSDHLVTGDAVNVAKRLEEAARADEVLVGSATERLARAAATFDLVEPIAAKGKSALVEAWRLGEVISDGAAVERNFETTFVGRADDLQELRRVFDRVCAERRCRRVTVLGVAGIGKSRLAKELCEELADHATFLRGRCLAYGEGITFWPVAEVIAQLGGDEATTAVLAAAEDGQLVAAGLAGLSGGGATQTGAEESFWAVRRLCEELARERPLVLCFEDLHWAEPTLLDLLEYLSGWIRDAPVLLLCLARPEFLGERPTWVGGEDGVTSLTLEPLTAAATNRLLDAIGTHPEARARIVEAAEGNPLYVEQMAAMVDEVGVADGLLSMPPTIHALLAARLDRLTLTERATIGRAAVAGKEFWLSSVVELTPSDQTDSVARSLLALVRKGFIRPHRSTLVPDDAFRFAHVLIRDAAYAGLAKEARAELHARFVRWIERNRDARELDEIVGYHLEQAYRARAELGTVDEAARTLAERAAEVLGRAGRRAVARDDVSAAVNLLDRALALATDEAPAALELRRQLSLALWSHGEIARAEALLDGVIEAASASGDRRLEWYGIVERAGRRTFDARATADEVLAVAAQAVTVFEELEDNAGLARAWREIANAHLTRGRLAAATDASERALDHAVRAADLREEARSADSLCTALLYGPVPVAAGIPRCKQLLEGSAGKPLREANVLIALAGLEAMCGDFDDARAHATLSLRTYHELGVRFAAAGAEMVAAFVETQAGDATAAEELLRRGYDVLRDVGAGNLHAALLADSLYTQGRYREAGSVFAEAGAGPGDDDPTSAAIWRAVASKLAARTLGGDAALDLADSAVELARSTESPDLRGFTLAASGEVLLLLGRPKEAAEAFRAAAHAFEEKGNVVAAERARALLSSPAAR